MSDPDDRTVSTLMSFLTVEDTEEFTGAGHVCAAACTGLAFLACHNIGAKGDDCLTGPFREKLLEIGAFGGLLFAALHPHEEEEFRSIIEQSAAIGVMYLSTMVRVYLIWTALPTTKQNCGCQASSHCFGHGVDDMITAVQNYVLVGWQTLLFLCAGWCCGTREPCCFIRTLKEHSKRRNGGIPYGCNVDFVEESAQ